jgi:thiamine biosynthesis protein ThiS
MQITLNNRIEILDIEKDKLTINELLKLKKYSFTRLIVKINGKIVKREHFDDITFSENDNVEVIHMISGG